MLECDTCQEAGHAMYFHTKSELQQHVNLQHTHLMEDKLMCTSCGKGPFQNAATLKQHIHACKDCAGYEGPFKC